MEDGRRAVGRSGHAAGDGRGGSGSSDGSDNGQGEMAQEGREWVVGARNDDGWSVVGCRGVRSRLWLNVMLTWPAQDVCSSERVGWLLVARACVEAAAVQNVEN